MKSLIYHTSLIDLQVNGFKGFDLNSDDLEPETVESLSEELCKAVLENIYLL